MEYEASFEFVIEDVVHQGESYKDEETDRYLIEIRGSQMNANIVMSSERYENLDNDLNTIVLSYFHEEYDKTDQGKVRHYTNDKVILENVKKPFDKEELYQLEQKYKVSYGSIAYDNEKIQIFGLNYVDESDKKLFVEELKKRYIG